MKRLRDEKTIRKIYRDGERRTSNELTLLYLQNQCHRLNYAIHVGKRFGIAVRRNKIKRVFRELLLQFKEKLVGYDIVIRPKKKAEEISFHQLSQRVEKLFIEAEIPIQK